MLINDAKRVWHRLWSVRLALLAALLGAVDVAMPFVAPERASLPFAALSVVVSLAAALSRLIVQRKLHATGEQDSFYSVWGDEDA
jgi:hypothetical protein